MKSDLKLKTFSMEKIYLKHLPELDLKTLTPIFSKLQWVQFKLLLMMLVSKRVTLMKSSLLVVLLEFQRSNKWSKISSTVKNQIEVLTLMKLLLMVLPSKVVFFVVKLILISSLLIPLHWVLVLKLLVVLWPQLYQNKLLSQPKKVKLSQLIKTTKNKLLFLYLKVKDH
jgi:hypothetical protein